MAKLIIGASVGPPEKKVYSEIQVRDLISQKTLSFYLACEVSDLDKIASERGIEKTEKQKPSGRTGYYYHVSDFPVFVRGVQKLVKGEGRGFINSVDATKDEFEIKNPGGSIIKFFKDARAE